MGGNSSGFCWNMPATSIVTQALVGRFSCDHEASQYYWIASMTGNCLQGVKCHGRVETGEIDEVDHCANVGGETRNFGLFATKPSEPSDYFIPLLSDSGLPILDLDTEQKTVSC